MRKISVKMVLVMILCFSLLVYLSITTYITSGKEVIKLAIQPSPFDNKTYLYLIDANGEIEVCKGEITFTVLKKNYYLRNRYVGKQRTLTEAEYTGIVGLANIVDRNEMVEEVIVFDGGRGSLDYNNKNYEFVYKEYQTTDMENLIEKVISYFPIQEAD